MNMDMKKLIGSLLALTLIVSAAQAQEQKMEGRHGRHHQKEMFAKQLNLTEDQKKQLKDIRADAKKQMADLKKNDNITVKEFNSRKDAIGKQQHEKMLALLTPDQKAQMEKMKQDRIAKGKERSQRGIEKMKTQLNLTDDQVGKLKASHEAFAAKAKDIRNNSTLTQDQKKEQFKDLAKQQREETKSILTKEQIQKMQELHKDHSSSSVK
jgi:Spy/CpxP family protein refolding chaperone